VTQENHYYPFGLNMEMDKWSNTPSVPDSKYQYNGKELNDDYGLGLMDFGARMYDAAIGKWNAVDPMADAYHAFSPYAYVLNNPIRLIDPNGMYSKDPIASRNTSIPAQDGSKSGGSGSTISASDEKDNGKSTNGRDFLGHESRSSNNVAICPTCDKDNPDHKPYIDDPNNLYTNLEGIIVNGDGSGAVITAKKYKPEPVDLFGALMQTADDYDTFFHNHDTYKTTKNEIKTILKPNGKVRSARALKFARRSIGVKLLGPLGDVYTLVSVSQKEDRDGLDNLDAVVAAASLLATAAAVVISTPAVVTFAGAVSVVGAVYGTGRLVYSIYENIK
jgi:RHS repeat-associated protein